MATILVDLDGTLVKNKWPDLGDWLPGAVDSVRKLLDAGHQVRLYSARLSPYWPDGSEREPGHMFTEQQRVRNLLDSAGLQEVGISPEPKPFYDVLIDDKSVRFPGGDRSWRIMLPKVLAIVKDEDTFHQVMESAHD